MNRRPGDTEPRGKARDTSPEPPRLVLISNLGCSCALPAGALPPSRRGRPAFWVRRNTPAAGRTDGRCSPAPSRCSYRTVKPARSSRIQQSEGESPRARRNGYIWSIGLVLVAVGLASARHGPFAGCGPRRRAFGRRLNASAPAELEDARPPRERTDEIGRGGPRVSTRWPIASGRVSGRVSSSSPTSRTELRTPRIARDPRRLDSGLPAQATPAGGADRCLRGGLPTIPRREPR